MVGEGTYGRFGVQSSSHSKQLSYDPTSISLSEVLRYAPPLLAIVHSAPAPRDNAACGRRL